MFDDRGPESSGKICKPDPEEMLQNARRRKEPYEQAIELLHQLGELNISLPQNSRAGIHELLGSCVGSVWECEKQENRWLEEIDKPEED